MTGLLERVLLPYKQDCTYLKSADITVADGLAAGRGEFEIPQSCYIDDTGHFNSVEFNICYNQLVYYVMACAVRDSLMPAFSEWTLADYWSRQLPSILITSLSSKFKRPIDPRSFSGEVEFTKLTRRDLLRPLLIAETTCRFWDASGGKAFGDVTLAILNPPQGG